MEGAMAKPPDATLKFADAEARLFLKARRLKDGARELDFDEMIVRHADGGEESAFVYDRGDERKLGRIKQQTPAGGAVANYNDVIEPLSPEDEKRLWGMYDRLLTNVAA
jgi:hypothetical protein